MGIYSRGIHEITTIILKKHQLSHYHIKKCVDTMNMGGRAYPVRHYPIAIRLRDRGGSRHSMSCAISSEWGLFGRKTRSAIQGTSSPRKYGRIMQPICNKIALESKLSRNFIANVHFLLYLCSRKVCKYTTNRKEQ